MSVPLALDTSAAIPLLVAPHRDHHAVVRWLGGRSAVLSGHALPETYSVLTRLPGDLRLAPRDAARLIRARFGEPLVLKCETAAQLPESLSRLEIAGGAVYDALVAFAARDHDADLVTRDGRARSTYETVGARVVVAA